jgi:hypothetical protein
MLLIALAGLLQEGEEAGMPWASNAMERPAYWAIRLLVVLSFPAFMAPTLIFAGCAGGRRILRVLAIAVMYPVVHAIVFLAVGTAVLWSCAYIMVAIGSMLRT